MAGRLRSAVVLTVAWMAGCGGDDARPSVDAGPEPVDVSPPPDDVPIVRPDAGPPAFVPSDPAAPEIPWIDAGPLGPVSLPVLTPCPAGWREVPPDDELSAATCEPWPESGMATCGVDAAHFPGEPGCVQIGSACPFGSWADDLPTDRPVIYVRAGADASGADGTMDRPFARVSQALATASPGDVVAVGRGLYDESLTVPEGVTLWGACVLATLIAPSSATTAAIRVTEGGVTIRNLGLQPAGTGILSMEDGDVHVEQVVIDRPVGTGIFAVGGRVTASAVVVWGARFATGSPAAIVAGDGGQIEMERVVVLRPVTPVAIGSLGAGARAVVRRAAIIEPTSPDGSGGGVAAMNGASLDASAVVIERYQGVGARVLSATATLEDVVIRDAVGEPLMAGGARAESGEMYLTRVRIASVRFAGVIAVGVDGRAHGEDVVVSGVAPTTSSDGVSAGVAAVDVNGSAGGRSVELTRTTIRDAVAGLLAGDGLVRLADAVIRGSPVPGRLDVGAEAIAGGRVELSRALLLRHRAAIVVAEAGSSATAGDVLLAENRYGLDVGRGATLDLERAAIITTDGFGLYAEGALDIRHVVVRGVRDTRDLFMGMGLIATNGATVTASHLSVDDAEAVGIVARGPGTTLRITDGRVSSTVLADCGSPSCEGLGFGYGVGGYDGASIELERFAVTDNAFGGLQLTHGGTADLHDGRVSGHAIGANVQSSGFDVTRLFDRVLFDDNDINVDGSLLAVPDAPEER